MKEISICNLLVFGYVERQDQLLFSLQRSLIWVKAFHYIQQKIVITRLVNDKRL